MHVFTNDRSMNRGNATKLLVFALPRSQGCKVIGCAGTDQKVQWLKELGFDVAFNYKTSNLSATLKEAAPNGIDVYFDCVSNQGV